MYSLLCFAIFVIPASFVVTVIADDYHSPFGVTFSPSAIFTSRYNASGLIHTTKHPTSPEYITYFNDALDIYGQPDKTDPLTHYHSRAYNETWSVFEASIDPVTATLTKELGHKPEYGAVFIPSIFHRDVIGAAGEAVFRVHDQPNMIGHNPLAATAAYKFLECAHLDRAPEECNDEGPVNYVLVLEYEKEYLGAMLKEVEFYLGTFPPKGEVMCRECGERYREGTDARAYEDKVRGAIDDLMNKGAVQSSLRESIRAVVVIGEASPDAVAAIVRIVHSVIGTHVQHVAEIEPEVIAAHGAAEYIRKIQREPHRFVVNAQSWDGWDEHDEL